MEHPLRSIRRLVDEALREMSPLFDSLYAEKGRVSIPPECLLRALVLQTLYRIPSERKLCEHLEYNLLFRCFVGLRFSQGAWHPTSVTNNRDRILTADLAPSYHPPWGREEKAQRHRPEDHRLGGLRHKSAPA